MKMLLFTFAKKFKETKNSVIHKMLDYKYYKEEIEEIVISPSSSSTILKTKCKIMFTFTFPLYRAILNY